MRILWWVIAVPVALLLVMLAVANRDLVTLSLDPVGGSVALPLYLVIFLAFLVGLVCGGVLTWFSGVKRRIRKRKAERDKALTAQPPARPTPPL